MACLQREWLVSMWSSPWYVMVGITRSKVISILEDAPSRFFFQFYVLCSGTSLYMKRMQFEVPKRLPPRVANFQAIIAMTNVSCSIFYVWVSAADSWWQPKQASKEKVRQG
jgi:hypothetical protein